MCSGTQSISQLSSENASPIVGKQVLSNLQLNVFVLVHSGERLAMKFCVYMSATSCLSLKRLDEIQFLHAMFWNVCKSLFCLDFIICLGFIKTSTLSPAMKMTVAYTFPVFSKIFGVRTNHFLGTGICFFQVFYDYLFFLHS